MSSRPLVPGLVAGTILLMTATASAQSVKEAIVNQSDETQTTQQLQSNGIANTQAVNTADVNAAKTKINQSADSMTTQQLQSGGEGNSEAVNSATVGK